MKIVRRNFLLASSAALLAQSKLSLGSSELENDEQSLAVNRFSATAKQVKVYTTADKTNHRISATDTLSFKSVGQPKETQTCIFVDPTRQFQSFLCIGGA